MVLGRGIRMNYLYKLVTTEDAEINYDAFKKKELIECLATIRDIYFSLKQENKQLKEQLQNISNEFLKYDWKNATQEQVYNQLKGLYESIFKEM